MANTIEIILRGVDDASDEFGKVEKAIGGVTDVLTGITRAGAAVAGVGVTMKKAFDLGREGAVIEQTSESFDFLMDKVGAAPDLLDQLTRASNDTISSFELQSSTMTLLAGAQGDLATALANATPRLLEIAKAANKLNPALGTTSFMYESIATGVKRAQPLILDNLGLTLKVGEANAAYAQELGKTVEELTSSERAMAILNATLEAGDTLIDQVGGTTEAATDSFDQLDKNMQEITDTIKKGLAPFLVKAAKALNDLLTNAKKVDDFLRQHEEEVRETAESYDLYREEMERVADVANRPILTQRELNNAIKEGGLDAHVARKALVILSEAQWNYSGAAEDAHEQTMLLREGFEDTDIAASQLADSEKILAEATERNADAAKDAARESKAFLDSIDRDVDSPIDNFIKDMEWFLATGGKFETAFARIKDLAKESPDEALRLARELFGVVIDTQEELNMLTGEEAAEKIKDTLGLELWEARGLIRGTDSIEEALMGVDSLNLQWRSLVRMRQLAEFTLADMRALAGTQWDIRANVSGLTRYEVATQTPETDIPVPSPGPGPQEDRGPGQQQNLGGVTQNFYPQTQLDVEEIAARLSEF